MSAAHYLMVSQGVEETAPCPLLDPRARLDLGQNRGWFL